jgi:hypothetical protein
VHKLEQGRAGSYDSSRCGRASNASLHIGVALPAASHLGPSLTDSESPFSYRPMTCPGRGRPPILLLPCRFSAPAHPFS